MFVCVSKRGCWHYKIQGILRGSWGDPGGSGGSCPFARLMHPTKTVVSATQSPGIRRPHEFFIIIIITSPLQPSRNTKKNLQNFKGGTGDERGRYLYRAGMTVDDDGCKCQRRRVRHAHVSVAYDVCDDLVAMLNKTVDDHACECRRQGR